MSISRAVTWLMLTPFNWIPWTVVPLEPLNYIKARLDTAGEFKRNTEVSERRVLLPFSLIHCRKKNIKEQKQHMKLKSNTVALSCKKKKKRSCYIVIFLPSKCFQLIARCCL